MTEFSRPKRKFSRLVLSLAVFVILGLVLAACGDTVVTNTPAATSAVTTQAATTAAANVSTATPVAVASTSATTTQAAATTTSASRTATATVAATTASAASTTTAAANASGTPGKPTPTPIPVPTVAAPQAALQVLDQIAQQATNVRRLQFKNPVEKFYVTREDFGKYQTASFNQENPPEEIAKSQKISELFGFIPKGYDLAKAYNDFSSSAVLGFYDPTTKKFYVVIDGDPNTVSPSVKFTAEHELTHALQDQNYDLTKLRDLPKPGQIERNDDRDLAILGLVEGDAVLSQTLWLQGRNLTQQEITQLLKENNQQVAEVEAKIKDLPLIIKDGQYFPYVEGAAFVQGIFQKGGWDAVNKMFTDYTPKSSSQILHPDKYAKKVEPLKVEIPDLTGTLGQGWKLVEANTVGEYQTIIWLKGAISDSEAKKAADGWTGDRYQALSDAQGRYGVVWRSAWDNQTEAKAFLDNAVSVLSKTYQLSGNGGSGDKRTWTTADYDLSLIQKNNEVLLTILPKGSGTDKVIAKIGF